MTRAFYRASCVAIPIRLADTASAGPASAEEAPFDQPHSPAPTTSPRNRRIDTCAADLGAAAPVDDQMPHIIVTGSLIRGTPVNGALPVEIHSHDGSQRRGSPMACDFARNLTASGPAARCGSSITRMCRGYDAAHAAS